MHQTIIASDYNKQEKPLISLGGLTGIVHVKKDIGSHGLYYSLRKIIKKQSNDSKVISLIEKFLANYIIIFN